MDYPNKINVKDYFDIHDYYSKQYGRGRTIILMQVGSFHEAYSTDEHGLDLPSLSQELDVHCTRKNSNIPLSKSNPRMMGFPIHVTYNFIDKLIDLNYTVVLIDQVTEPPEPERKVTGIFSPGTHIDKKNTNTSYLVSIVLDSIKDKAGKKLVIGLSAYDLATGIGSIFETYSKSSDSLLGLDDALRFMESHPPREIILENCLTKDDNVASLKADDVLSYLGLEEKNTYNIKIQNHKKISWQKKLFESIYKPDTNIDIIDKLELSTTNWSRLSLTLLLDYVMSHQPRLLEKLRQPEFYSSNKYLYLGNRALEQLNVHTKNPNETNLFEIINYTKTSIGKRYLNFQLSNPLIDIKEINKRYDNIEKLLSKNHQVNLLNYLEDIFDLDKLIRKLEIGSLCPAELYQIYLSFYQIDKMNEYFKMENLIDTFDISSSDIKEVKKILKYIESNFILDTINGLNFINYTETDKTIYKNTVHESIDKINNKINLSTNFINLLVKELEKYVEDKSYFKKKDTDEEKTLINVKYNERDGHYLLITNKRCSSLRKNLSKVKSLKVEDISVKVEDLTFNELPKAANTKINCKQIKDLSENLVSYKQDLAKEIKTKFIADMKTLLEKHGEFLRKISKKIAYIDFINSGALVAVSNHYSKPIIKSKQQSYFISKQMRHPIIEKISTETVYVPHDIELGNGTEQDGILLYGINSSGKSTLMKSIGLNIIMAQIGYYTATQSFEYSPYSSLFTRICGNDNMFKGLSSFMVEMLELMAILKRNDSKTMMIGDEICRGTEERSANVIVCYMLEALAEKNSSFITATHLHKIANLNTVKNIKRVKAKHLKITYDQTNDTLIYDRHLSDGQGETFYGLQVAKYLMKDNIFNERTKCILEEYDELSNIKTSKYNSEVYVDSCHICNSSKKLETHHIVWQKDFNKNNINESKFYLQKNDSSNLVVLCQECHDKVDRDDIIINGWLNTSKGKKLDFKICEPSLRKKSKYSDDIINWIKEIKTQVNNDEKLARIKIKEKFSKKISTTTIKSIWSN